MAKILLADDEPYITSIVALKLNRCGHESAVADDGGRAFDLAAAGDIDVVVTDYQMPVLSGHELCVKLKADPRTAHIPVVMLTGRGHRLSDEDLAQTNIRHMMGKPFSVKELVAKIESCLPNAKSEAA